MNVNSLTLDVVLAIFFPLFLLLVGRRLLPPLSWTGIRQILAGNSTVNAHQYSLRRAFTAYMRYTSLSEQEISLKERSYTSIGRYHKQLGYKIGYPAKLVRLRDATSLNAQIASAITKMAQAHFGLEGIPLSQVNYTDLTRVRESLKHFVRDWSTDGAQERDKIFTPIIQVLAQVMESERPEKKVLIPGSGLGRLAWEVTQLGFDTTAVEFSQFMTLAMRFLFSPETTKAVNEHSIQPFAHWFSHQRSNKSLFRSIAFPDVVPRFTPNFHLIEDDFLKVPPSVGYDYVVTLFFIDTSSNILSTIEKIHQVLRPGGTWINLGPLLWPGGGQAKLELSLEEVLRASQELGFTLHLGDAEAENDIFAPKTVECEYTSDSNAMMRWLYQAEFWVATKK